jgi:hypothetical protein
MASSLRAQSAATVPASSALYDILESISARFPARGTFLGERSLSRREVERILARLAAVIESARAESKGPHHDWARREVAALRKGLEALRARDQSKTTARFAWRADVISSDAGRERIESNGLGELDALTHAFAGRRDGWPMLQGSAVTVAPSGVLGTGDWFSLAVQPRLSSIDARAPGSVSRWQGFLHRAYARAVVRNVAVRAGLDEMIWGQSPIGALFISGNAPPLPALVVGTDTPVTLPWWFRHTGPVRITVMLADLGGSQEPPHAKLAGWQVSVMPWSRFELGVSVLTQTGGSGGPKATFFERVVDLFPVIDALAPQHADLQISNKLAGGNLRLRFPELGGLDVYYELQIDDFDGRRLRSSLVDDAAHLLGARMPLITSRGQFSLRAEWHNTSLRLYEHAQFRSGVTYREHLIGNPLGPNAQAGYLTMGWQRSPLDAVELALASERRDPSQYTVTTSDPRDRGFQFVRLTDDPDIRRTRLTTSVTRSLGLGSLRVTLGHNLAWRTGQPKRDEWLGLISLTSQRLAVF